MSNGHRGQLIAEAFACIRLLRTGRRRAAELAAEIGCSTRATYRILSALERVGIRVERHTEDGEAYLRIPADSVLLALGLEDYAEGRRQPRPGGSGVRALSREQAVDLRARRAAGDPASRLAREYGVSVAVVAQIATGVSYQDVGGPRTEPRKREAPPLSAEQVEEIRRRRKAGESLLSIARDVGTTKANVSLIVRGLAHRDDGGPIASARNQLDVERARAIRRRHEAGESQTSLARAFGVSAATICNVVHRKAWRDA